MKAVGSSVTLRAVSWEGSLPVAGDWLRTRSGRTYEIERVRGDACPLRLDCVIIPPGLPAGDIPVHSWFWNVRRARLKALRQIRKDRTK